MKVEAASSVTNTPPQPVSSKTGQSPMKTETALIRSDKTGGELEWSGVSRRAGRNERSRQPEQLSLCLNRQFCESAVDLRSVEWAVPLALSRPSEGQRAN